MKFEDLSDDGDAAENKAKGDHKHQFKNKQKVAVEKLNNKRKQKEANKQKKINKGKGIVETNPDKQMSAQKS